MYPVHDSNEFLTFCSCQCCDVFRKVVFRLVSDYFRASQIVAVILNVFMRTYGPILKLVHYLAYHYIHLSITNFHLIYVFQECKCLHEF